MASVPTWQPVVGCIIGSNVTCDACIIDEQRVEDQQFRPVQDMWIVDVGGLHCISGRRRGRGSRLVRCRRSLSHVVRLFFVEEGETGVCMRMISLEERGFRSCGEGLRIDDGVANGTLCD